MLVVMNRYEYIYRKASFNFEQSSESQKPVYLKLMLDVTHNLIELLGIASLKETESEKKLGEFMDSELALLGRLLENTIYEPKKKVTA
jgi:hypothetical protein